MRQSQSSLIDLAMPIRPLIGHILFEIERRLNLDNAEIADEERGRCFEESDDIVVSSMSVGQVLNLTSRSGCSASRKAMQLCTGEFENEEFNVLYVSRTLSEYDLACNLIAQGSGVNVDKLASGRLSNSEWDRLELVLEQMCDRQLAVIHTQQIEIPLLRQWLKYVSSKFDSTPLVVLDDQILLEGCNCSSANVRQQELLELSRIALSVDALIVLVGHAWAH